MKGWTSRAHPAEAASACACASCKSGSATSLPAASSAACRARSGEAVLRSGSPMRPSSAASSDAASLRARGNAAVVTGAAWPCRFAHAQCQAGQHAHRQRGPQVSKLAGRLQPCRMAACESDTENGHARAQQRRAVTQVAACTQINLPVVLICGELHSSAGDTHACNSATHSCHARARTSQASASARSRQRRQRPGTGR
jgi:hypothetical protein